MMYISQLRKIGPYDWFCVPGSHISTILACVSMASGNDVNTWAGASTPTGSQSGKIHLFCLKSNGTNTVIHLPGMNILFNLSIQTNRFLLKILA